MKRKFDDVSLPTNFEAPSIAEKEYDRSEDRGAIKNGTKTNAFNEGVKKGMVVAETGCFDKGDHHLIELFANGISTLRLKAKTFTALHDGWPGPYPAPVSDEWIRGFFSGAADKQRSRLAINEDEDLNPAFLHNDKLEILARRGPEASYPNVAETGAADLVNGSEKLISSGMISIFYKYPIEHPVSLNFRSIGGFTRELLFLCIQAGYREIYQNEHVYRVWGHPIESLWVEGVEYDSDKELVFLRMGS